MSEEARADAAEETVENDEQKDEELIAEHPTEPAPKTIAKPKLILNFFRFYWKTILVIVTPIILIPIIFIDEQKTKALCCLYTVLLMAVFWVTEAIPMAVTSLIPIFAFPFFGILESGECFRVYLSETLFMFMGGLFLATGVELSGLHFRFALRTLMITGCSHRRLTFGVFFATMFVSMWIANAAATAMMAPIVTAILQTLEEGNMLKLYYPPDEPGHSLELRPTRTTLCYFIGVAYASTIGGTGVIIGTGTNLVARGQIETYFPETVVTFPGWMLAAIPPMLLDMFGIWLWMNFLYLGFIWKGGCDKEVRNLLENQEERKIFEKAIKEIIEQKYRDLGPMSWHEKSMAIIFTLMVSLWLTRAPEIFPGWADRIHAAWGLDASLCFFLSSFNFIVIYCKCVGCFTVLNLPMYKKQFIFPRPNRCDINGQVPSEIGTRMYLVNLCKITDSCVAYFGLFLMSILPANLSFLHGLSKDARKIPEEPSPPLAPWGTIQKKLPWSLIFLIGSGFAIAKASKESDMNEMIGGWLTALGHLPPFSIMLISCLIATGITELASNVAVLNILGPVLAVMIEKLNLNGAYLMIPVALCCSFGFCLPVGTPPNAMVAGLHNIPTKEMMVAGTFPNLWTYVITVFSFEAFGQRIFT